MILLPGHLESTGGMIGGEESAIIQLLSSPQQKHRELRGPMSTLFTCSSGRSKWTLSYLRYLERTNDYLSHDAESIAESKAEIVGCDPVILNKSSSFPIVQIREIISGRIVQNRRI